VEEDDFISKSRRKRESHALQDLGEALVVLPAEQLARIDLPEKLRAAVTEARNITKHEARRRQMQYIGKLMRAIDAEPIRAQVEAIHAPSERATALFHLAERWRRELLANDDALAGFAREFPSADVAAATRLVAQAKAERDAGRAPKHFRELFHFVNALVQDRAGSEP
jgi:ribosome-associated protein